MKVIFAGTPLFGKVILEKLLSCNDIQISAVLTQADKKAGRGRKLQETPVKLFCLENDLICYQPSNLSSHFINLLKHHRADLILVVAYGFLLPPSLLNITPLGCINIHASLLPKYRGASPIQEAILNGDKETGISVMQMEESLDSGSIFYQEKCSIKQSDNAKSLHDKLAELAASSIVQFLPNLASCKLKPVEQNHKLASFCYKISKQQARINWQQHSTVVYNFIRAYNPYPIAFSILNGKVIRIFKASISSSLSMKKAGTIIGIDKEKILVACLQNTIAIEYIQMPDSKVLAVSEVLKGNKSFFEVGMCFE